MSYLPAIENFLVEDTEFIADTVTIGSQTQWSHGVQETSWKPEAAHEKRQIDLWLSIIQNGLSEKVWKFSEFIQYKGWKDVHQQGGRDHHFPGQHLPQCPPVPPCPGPTTKEDRKHHTIALTLITWNVTVITGIKPHFSHLVSGLITGILKCEVHHGVLEGATHVKLKGDVIHTLQWGKRGEIIWNCMNTKIF